MPVTYTPLRFPGGKTKLYDYVKPLIHSCIGPDGVYVEACARGIWTLQRERKGGCLNRLE